MKLLVVFHFYGRNPLWGRLKYTAFPRVAAEPQPWAGGLNPVGIPRKKLQSGTHNEPRKFNRFSLNQYMIKTLHEKAAQRGGFFVEGMVLEKDPEARFPGTTI
ncbi:MAG: hypothetical protein AVO33_01880 [delta proteobacterium ML8_F1]|nr:MAG: hypothetical protein AVO33_01880 [delta proteobacterium ML8_F1]